MNPPVTFGDWGARPGNHKYLGVIAHTTHQGGDLHDICIKDKNFGDNLCRIHKLLRGLYL
jgi:hypothetical protein